MRKRTSSLLWVCLGGFGGLALACSSSPPGEATGSVSSALGGDDDGDDGDGADFYQVRAQQGLNVTPVTLNLAGKTRDEIDQIGYGSYLVNAGAGCTDCHTWQGGGFLAGGRPFTLGPGLFVTSRNLTPDPTTGLPLSEDQFITALETGRDFHAATVQALIVMPWNNYRWSSTADKKAIYAYLRAIPPVSHLIPPDNKPVVAPIPLSPVYNTGDVDRALPRDHQNRSQSEWRRGLAVSPLAEPRDLDDDQRAFGRGSYLVNAIDGCSDCHTNPNYSDPATFHVNTAMYLAGGREFTAPPPTAAQLFEERALSADLLGATHGFFAESTTTFEVFKEIIRTGTHADENPARPLAFPMPWSQIRNQVDDDLLALYTYLNRTPPVTGARDKLIPDYARWCATNADCRAGETCFANPATSANECVGGPCNVDSDCDACQTCNAGACAGPTASSTCLTKGL
jgi:hypothetical protein